MEIDSPNYTLYNCFYSSLVTLFISLSQTKRFTIGKNDDFQYEKEVP